MERVEIDLASTEDFVAIRKAITAGYFIMLPISLKEAIGQRSISKLFTFTQIAVCSFICNQRSIFTLRLVQLF